MSKRIKRPLPTLATEMILAFGLKFLSIKGENPTAESLFKGFVESYGIVGHDVKSSFGRGDYIARELPQANDNTESPTQSYEDFQNRRKEALRAAIEPYLQDEAVVNLLRETLIRLQEMVWTATVASLENPEELLTWIKRWSPKYELEFGFWVQPGRTKCRLNSYNTWTRSADFTTQMKKMLEIFGVFRSSFIENLGKSLDAYGSGFCVREKAPGSLEILKGDDERWAGQSRPWSNGEFYFAACPYCKAIFKKGNFDTKFCSKKCAVYFSRKKPPEQQP